MVDADQARVAEFLRASESEVLDQWSEIAARGVNGRISPPSYGGSWVSCSR